MTRTRDRQINVLSSQWKSLFLKVSKGEVDLRRAVVGLRLLREGKLPEVFPVRVNYDLPLKRAIKRGHYDSVDPIITAENFPTDRKGKMEIEIELICLHLSSFLTTAYKWLDNSDYRSVELRELLALFEQYSGIRTEIKTHIIALDPNSHHNPYIDTVLSKPDLCVIKKGTFDFWNRFAVVRK